LPGLRHHRTLRDAWRREGIGAACRRSGAVRADTDLLGRSRELQKSWERLVAYGGLGSELPPGATEGLRPTILESWRRSLATGLDPTDVLAPIEAAQSEVQLRMVAEESGGIVAVTDASRLVLYRIGDEGLKERAAEMNLVEGARYSEEADGTKRDRDCAGRRPRLSGVRLRALQPTASRVGLLRRSRARPRVRQTVGLIDLSGRPSAVKAVFTAWRAYIRAAEQRRAIEPGEWGSRPRSPSHRRSSKHGCCVVQDIPAVVEPVGGEFLTLEDEGPRADVSHGGVRAERHRLGRARQWPALGASAGHGRAGVKWVT
jgi:hypothetical protein